VDAVVETTSDDSSTVNEGSDEEELSDNNDDLSEREDDASMAESEQAEDDAVELYLEDIALWRKQTFSDARPLPAPCSIKFNPKKLLTGVVILGLSPFGNIRAGSKSLVHTNVADEEEELQEPSAFEAPASQAALPRALWLVDSLVSNKVVKINAGKDDSLDIYDTASLFEYKQRERPFTKGWARRPLSGDLYGKNAMNDEYYQLLLEMVRRGVTSKSDKMNPKQTYDVLFEKYRKYSLPSEQVIRNSIQGMLEKISKEDKLGGTAPASTGRRRGGKQGESKNLQDAEAFLAEALAKKIRQQGWEGMKPKRVLDRLLRKEKKLITSSKLTKSEMDILCKRMRAKFSSMKSQKKNRRANRKKKAIV
jgi:hypothetical protein